MSKYVYAARIVHDPMSERYLVEAKDRWWHLVWNLSCQFGYEAKDPRPHMDTQEQAYARAEKEAKRLLNCNVVWEERSLP